MKTRTLKFIPEICGAAVLATSVFLTNASAAILVFDPSVTTNFESFNIGDAAWGTNSEFKAVAPRAGNSSTRALEVANTSRQAGFSSQQTPTFTGDTLYFSFQINVTSVATSGARIQIASTNTGGSTATGKLGGIGVMDISTEPPNGGTTAINRLTFYDASTGSWLYSDITLTSNTWYELALVIELNPTTPSESLGYFYYRAVGDEEFTIVREFSGYEMSWYTAEFNASDFAYWRIENARSSVQLDNFSAGTVIPEPSAALLLAFSLLALLSSRRRS